MIFMVTITPMLAHGALKASFEGNSKIQDLAYSGQACQDPFHPKSTLEDPDKIFHIQSNKMY